MKKITNKNQKIQVIARTLSIFLVLLAMFAIPAFASGGSVESSLKSFANLIFTIVRIVGVIMTLWGAVEFAQSVAQHDGAAKFRGAMVFVAGLIIVFAKEILAAIGVTL